VREPESRYCFVPVTAFWLSDIGGVRSMSVDSLRPEVNLLSAFILAIGGAFAMGLPVAAAIILICS
jgi:hypothetical protein